MKKFYIAFMFLLCFAVGNAAVTDFTCKSETKICLVQKDMTTIDNQVAYVAVDNDMVSDYVCLQSQTVNLKATVEQPKVFNDTGGNVQRSWRYSYKEKLNNTTTNLDTSLLLLVLPRFHV